MTLNKRTRLGITVAVAVLAGLTSGLAGMLVLVLAGTTDRATPSPVPDAWRMQAITAAAAALGLLGLAFAVGVIAVGKGAFGLGVEELRTLAFVTLVFANQAMVYAVRDRRHMWCSRPSGWLLLSSLFYVGFAIVVAFAGVLMASLQASIIALALAATIAFSIVLDGVKSIAFRRLGLAGEEETYERATAIAGAEQGIGGAKQPGLTDRSVVVTHKRRTLEAGLPGIRGVAGGARWGWLMPAGVLAVLASGFGWPYRSSRGGVSVHYITQKVERESAVRTVTARGPINAAITESIRTHVSGVIQSLYCDYGAKVKAGQLCAKLDSRTYQILVDRNEAALAAAERRRASDNARLAHRKAILARDKTRTKRGAISRYALDASKRSYEQALIQTRLEEASLAKLRAALDGAKFNLKRTKIVSPSDGTVVSRNVEIGQTVVSSAEAPPLFLIATDLAVVRVDVDLHG